MTPQENRAGASEPNLTARALFCAWAGAVSLLGLSFLVSKTRV